MGQSKSQQSVQQQYQIIKTREDGSALLQHKKTRNEFLLRNICSNFGQEISGFENLLKKRALVKSPHLLELIQIRRKEEENVCSIVHKIYLLIQYPFKSLQDEINRKILAGRVNPFIQAQLWSILYSCCIALNTLYSKKMPHESLTASNIFISRDGLIKIADPLALGLQKNYIRVLKKDYHHVHLSPEIMNFLDDCNFSFYDKQKSDIFILGAILLQASLLNGLELYEKQTKRPLLDIVPKALKQIRQRYSNAYVQTLEKMLHLHSKFRPKFTDIITLIQEDSSLYEDTESTNVPPLSTTRQSFKNNKNLKTQNNQMKVNAPPGISIHKTSSNFSQNTTKNLVHNVPNNIHMTNYNENQAFMKKKEDQILIKMLQTENLRSNQIPQSNFLPQDHNHRQVYFNSSPKPTGFQISPPPNNQQPQQFQQFKSPSYFASYQNFTNISHNPYPQSMPQMINNTIIPSSSKTSQIQKQRFSTTKFGNITLDTKKVNNKPIYSHQIPQINQLLQKSFHFQTSKSNPIFQNNASIQQNNPLNNSFHYSYSTENQNNQYDTVSTPKYTKQSISKSNISASPSQSQSNNHNEPTAEVYKEITPYIPELNFNEQVKIIENNNNSELKATRQSHSIEKNKNYPHYVPTSNQFKQREEKKVIISVTQKSQQNEFTPNKNKENSLEMPVRINEPQKSPGPKQTLPNNPSQSYKKLPQTIKRNKNPDELEFVRINIEGGGKYEGYVKNGMKNGEGRLQFNDGGFYIGEWKDNKMHGFGKIHYQNGQVAYEGNWQNDQFFGEGRVYNDLPEKLLGPFNYHDFANLGQKWIYYEGEFKNDSKHGKGKIRLTNGQVFEGSFVFDTIEGQGIFYTYNGEAISGFWSDNVLMDQ